MVAPWIEGDPANVAAIARDPRPRNPGQVVEVRTEGGRAAATEFVPYSLAATWGARRTCRAARVTLSGSAGPRVLVSVATERLRRVLERCAALTVRG